MPLEKEDYVEPNCPFCADTWKKEKKTERIPVGRVFEKLDGYFAKNDYAAAERHLLYWASEAEALGDKRGLSSVADEQMGLYRKLGKREEAYAAVKKALALVKELEMEKSVAAATAYLNAATVYKAFGEPEKGLPLFDAAREIYEKELTATDGRLGGLYNNTALSLCDLGRYAEARELYEKAVAVMSKVENGELDAAITWLNLADLAAAEKGYEAAEKEIGECLEKAEALLNAPSLPWDGYYAFVCEKCASVFDFYGRFLTAKELKERSKKIYERA